jgi:quinol monooxygenase YgiN
MGGPSAKRCAAKHQLNSTDSQPHYAAGKQHRNRNTIQQTSRSTKGTTAQSPYLSTHAACRCTGRGCHCCPLLLHCPSHQNKDPQAVSSQQKQHHLFNRRTNEVIMASRKKCGCLVYPGHHKQATPKQRQAQVAALHSAVLDLVQLVTAW